ncbi:hypothetical protein CR513_42697, partial [Mucuna pruriens]
MSSPQGFDAESKSQPIPLSSSESEALAVMPESVAVAEGTSSRPSAPIVPSPQCVGECYEWVSEEVLSYRLDVVRSDMNLLMVEGEGDFIYMYKITFKDLGVSLHIDYFAVDILRTLGVAPSQLHPNSWAAMQAFQVICQALALIPSASLFLSHYTTMVRALCELPLLWTLNPFHSTRGCPPSSTGCLRGNLPQRIGLICLRALIKKVAQASKARASSLAPASQAIGPFWPLYDGSSWLAPDAGSGSACGYKDKIWIHNIDSNCQGSFKCLSLNRLMESASEARGHSRVRLLLIFYVGGFTCMDFGLGMWLQGHAEVSAARVQHTTLVKVSEPWGSSFFMECCTKWLGWPEARFVVLDVGLGRGLDATSSLVILLRCGGKWFEATLMPPGLASTLAFLGSDALAPLTV